MTTQYVFWIGVFFALFAYVNVGYALGAWLWGIYNEWDWEDKFTQFYLNIFWPCLNAKDNYDIRNTLAKKCEKADFAIIEAIFWPIHLAWCVIALAFMSFVVTITWLVMHLVRILTWPVHQGRK
jgi:hypothetical protein